MAISNNSTGLRTGVCTSTTRPTTPYEGQHIYETDTDFEYVWNGSAWVRIYTASTTTKGDLQTFSTEPTRLAAGSNYQILRSNTSTATGLEWVNSFYSISAGAVYGGAGATTVTFPSGRFTVSPILVPTNLDSTWTPLITAISASSFTYNNSVGGNASMYWIAIQMTLAASAG